MSSNNLSSFELSGVSLQRFKLKRDRSFVGVKIRKPNPPTLLITLIKLCPEWIRKFSNLHKLFSIPSFLKMYTNHSRNICFRKKTSAAYK